MSRRSDVPFEVIVDHWSERDERYRSRRVGLTSDEEAAVLAWRRLEVASVSAPFRQRAEAILMRWVPPSVRRIA